MKLLSEILYKAGSQDIQGSLQLAIELIAFDSRKISKNTLFVACKGGQVDGHEFIDAAIEKGAVAVICEEFPKQFQTGVTYIKVANSRLALSHVASNFYNQPSEKIKIIGVTGTNGKTTTATLLYQLFKKLGYKCGLLSTVKNMVDNERLESSFTTPDPIQLNELLAKMVEKKCPYCFMEVSSHALDQYRVHGIRFEGAIFSNITHDHLDYHQTFDAYIRAKKTFFDLLDDQSFALVNKDDKHWQIMIQNTQAKTYTYAIHNVAEYRAKMIENSIQGLHAMMDGQEVWLRLIGKFNLYNALAVYAVADLLGVDQNDILMNVSMLEGAEGRFEVIRSEEGKSFIVDYAHTPDALEKILENIKASALPQQKIITVVGCGGNRDAQKRPEMAKIAAHWSEKCVFTSDNPRNEEASEILDQMMSGISSEDKAKVLCIADRKEAIQVANQLSGPQDIVLVAGKGHEKYQEIKGVKHPFDDVQVIQSILNR